MRIIFALALLLAVTAFSNTARADGYYANGAGYIPVYPRYPYRAGHYPKADWYYQLPPYTAIHPRFYRKLFMMAQERNRYRYIPNIFHGYGDGERIEDVDVRGISSSLRENYAE